ncbi:MAG: T9SS type A sorting domain-containing protein, partial [Cytophagaceae bacterium]|nr:T9SS type A sorting domain-containing protein [Cytophagaceae bacterium]
SIFFVHSQIYKLFPICILFYALINNNAGNHEFLQINTVSGNTITICNDIIRQYTPGMGVQLITVPQYTGGLTVNTTLTALPWNGTTGGVLVFEAGSVTLSADIDVSGKGFRGGDNFGGGDRSNDNGYRYGSADGLPPIKDTLFTCGWVQVTSATSNSPIGGAWRSPFSNGCGCTITMNLQYRNEACNSASSPLCVDPIADPVTYIVSKNLECWGVQNTTVTTRAAGAKKGEGITAWQNWFLYGRAPLANGGGGGNEHNGGGGGGKGFTGSAVLDSAKGFPGRPLNSAYNNAVNKIFLGGGGGTGQGNNNVGSYGQPGGGIIIIKATSIVPNGFSIRANGREFGSAPNVWNAGMSRTDLGPDGVNGTAGIDGAGGAILLDIVTYVAPVNVESKGARGGNVDVDWGITSGSGYTDSYGPGGGGGGGVIWVSQAALPVNISPNVTGGAAGLIVNGPNPAQQSVNTGSAYGATPGQPGAVVTGLVLSGVCVLPVKFISFTARENNAQVELEWRTSSEKNSSSFVIERSNNAFDFFPIGKIGAAGNSDNILSYYFTDPDPLFGISYYRIKEIDTDGSLTFSGLATVDLSNTLFADVYPVPAQDEVSVYFFAHQSGEVKFNIIDVQGRIFYSVEKYFNEGVCETIISTKNLAAGVYYLQLTSDDQSTIRKIVIE